MAKKRAKIIEEEGIPDGKFIEPIGVGPPVIRLDKSVYKHWHPWIEESNLP